MFIEKKEERYLTMKIRELMEALSHLNPDLEVRIPDTFWQSEGWGEAAEDFDRLNPLNNMLNTRR